MMNSIVEEKLVSFKELEQKIFDYVCELGRDITRIMLESYDEELAGSRDTKLYRDKYILNAIRMAILSSGSKKRQKNSNLF